MHDKPYYTNGQAVYKNENNWMTYYYKSGKIKADGPFENDQMEGEWKFYRETGQLMQIGNFKNNQKHGAWIRFDKNDQIEYNEVFEDGKIIKKK